MYLSFDFGDKFLIKINEKICFTVGLLMKEKYRKRNLIYFFLRFKFSFLAKKITKY